MDNKLISGTILIGAIAFIISIAFPELILY